MSGSDAREIMIDAIRRELFGPAIGEVKCGTPVDPMGLSRDDLKKGPIYDCQTGQEILFQTDPLHRYGIGVLYPQLPSDWEEGDDETPIPGLGTGEASENDDQSIQPIQEQISDVHETLSDSDDFDLTDANKYKPSAMAISFACLKDTPSKAFAVTVHGATYDKLAIADNSKKQAWLRRPFTLSGFITHDMLANKRLIKEIILLPNRGSSLPDNVRAQIFSRTLPGEADDRHRLVTISVSNISSQRGPEHTLFQMSFSVKAIAEGTFEPYPDGSLLSGGIPEEDLEEKSLDLLYRNRVTYAVGHGCSATWQEKAPVHEIQANPLPSYEVPNMTPNIRKPGTDRFITISMRELALGTQIGRDQVEELLSAYANWIKAQSTKIESLDVKYLDTAQRHIKLCTAALTRMREGWSLVVDRPDSKASQAFRWMNEAMLYQQLRSRLPLHKKTSKNETIPTEDDWGHLDSIEDIQPPRGTGQWRPFQIAFILTVIPELADPTSPHRSTVDLIYFPTGGGKTEAYLGASAFSLLMRRLRNPEDTGTDTLMRYTLRLLTTQQFQRASSLICVLEDIRSRHEKALGSSQFGIGVWLGRSTTPNTCKQAVDALRDMRRHGKSNSFLLLKCPWCGAQMGLITDHKRGSRHEVLGYEESRNRVLFRCWNQKCRYSRSSSPMPIYVVDEDIYKQRPSIIIGTVDKFAMLAWNPEARALFNIGEQGEQLASPPGLIIQDELHLISGPLGSMVGLYESVIDELCTGKTDSGTIVPKIIASTATARNYQEQIKTLFGRTSKQTAIFPPHGLEEGHSFFAEPEVSDDGTPTPGKRYLGIFSASLGSTQTVQVRIAAATLQAACTIPEEDRDGYWTNLNYFNSLRELGNTVTLLQSDVRDYLKGMQRSDGFSTIRWPERILELTSRISNQAIPDSIEKLETSYSSADNKAIDICLASNIIEVGIDIDRLALMTIVGQPKTTAQYIQVSGRVGRKPKQAPGLVITIYGASKPRDRSHFERFQTYHEQLYAQVEPTSSTPFARPALKRALHAAIIGYIRQTGPIKRDPYPFPEKEFNHAAKLVWDRASLADCETLKDLHEQIDDLRQNWRAWEKTEWRRDQREPDDNNNYLMRPAGTQDALGEVPMVWDIPTSMRTVDAECHLKITSLYNREDGETKREND